MWILAALALLSIPQDWIDPQHQDIPTEFRGTWALSPDLCKEGGGPAFVRIGARHIYFYEKYGYLELAQLNEVGDTPSFYGQFKFAEHLKFSEETVRLDLHEGNLVISEIADSDDPMSKARWTKCSSLED